MKKILILLLVCVCMVGCAEKKPYTEISYQETQNKLENKDTFILIIGSHNCNKCQEYTENLKDIVKKYKVKMYYIDVANMSEEENKKFANTIIYSGTPTTVFIEDGAEKSRYNRIEGSLKYEEIVKKLKKNGYIKED